MFAALGKETRMHLLVMLNTGVPQSIKQLTMELALARQAVTKHLRVLEAAKVVTQKTQGRERRFVAGSTGVEEAQLALKRIAQRWDEALIRLKNFVEETQ